MSNPYPHRWKTKCDLCNWSMTAYEYERAAKSAEVHGYLKDGHKAEVVAIA